MTCVGVPGATGVIASAIIQELSGAGHHGVGVRTGHDGRTERHDAV